MHQNFKTYQSVNFRVDENMESDYSKLVKGELVNTKNGAKYRIRTLKKGGKILYGIDTEVIVHV